MSYKTKLYLITAHTNMHVGSGKQSYAIIDNLVQRDAITGLPVIHSSSLKGALREFFTQQLGKDHDLIIHAFGKEMTHDDRNNSAGEFRFFNGHLLSIPVRSNVKPFFRATSSLIYTQLKETLNNSNISLSENIRGVFNRLENLNSSSCYHFDQALSGENVILEDFDKEAIFNDEVNTRDLKDLFGEDLVWLDPVTLSELCDDNHLPVIARNSLENGRSTNLWYEQIVPRQTRFVTTIMYPSDSDAQFRSFEDYLTANQLIQIGANASIGYGFCKFQAVPILDLGEEVAA